MRQREPGLASNVELLGLGEGDGGLGVGCACRDGQRRRLALAQLGLTTDDVALVGRLPLFGGVAPPRLARLLTGASVRFYERNARLFAQGEPADRFFVVLDGWVRLFREAPAGQESTIAVFGPGESLAEAAMLDSARYPVSGSVAGRGAS